MKKIDLLAGCLLLVSLLDAQTRISNPLTDNRHDPLGIDDPAPRFSWQLSNDAHNLQQTAYQLRLFEIGKKRKIYWNSGKINSDASVMIPYGGPALQSRTRYGWVVDVWDNKSVTPAHSDTAYFQTAFLHPSDWQAKWIQPGYTEDEALRPSPLFRKTFNTKKKIVSAYAYITAHGLYEAHINGKRVGDAYFTPGWTAYQKRVQYQVYDVTGLLQKGENAIGVTLANGWYRGVIGFSNHRNVYGSDIALLMQLEIQYSDGSREIVVSDDSWKSTTGAIRSAEIYNGEIQDTRLEKNGWDMPGYADAGWSGVTIMPNPGSELVATENEMVHRQESFKAEKLIQTPKDEQVLDFGQNLVGWVRFKVNGKPGDTVKIYHAEVLDKAGNFYTTNLRAAKAEDIYVLKGGEEILEPHFTWHGFRYIRIEGYPGRIAPENFVAYTFYSDMPKTGSFHTSNAQINQLQHNIEWGQKGNFIDVPTDCPQRDERLGWTGDAQVFSRTASFNRNVDNFFRKWLKDLSDDQLPNGAVPHVIPNVLGQGAAGSAGWADVSCIIPWNMYLAYGDTVLLRNQYNSMKAWVGYMQSKSQNDLWNTGDHFGDWLFYRPDDDNSGRAAVTDKYLIAQCFYAHSTQLVIDAAKVLGMQDDAVKYTALLDRIKKAFRLEYLTPNGRLVSGTQTAYVLALNFDMLPDSLRQQAADRLVQNIRSYGNHLTTGFLGTPYLCHVLTRYGYTDIAYTLLLQQKYPSWLYPVTMGATTIWERWDGIKPDGSFEVPSMNSYNHYAYGAIGDWMYRVMAGLDTEEDGVGYKHSRIQPHLGGGFTDVSASLDTYYGELRNAWKLTGKKLSMDCTVPANTKCTIYVPASAADKVLLDGKPVDASAQWKDGYLQLTVGSGSYHFSSEIN